MTEQIIRRFSESGKAQGSKLIQTRETIHKTLMGRMKDEGYARLFDLDPVWKWNWDKDDIYDFTYTIQGVYVGKESAWQTEGILGGKAITSTPKIK